MNKPLSEMTDEELEHEYATWDLKVRNAISWGAAMAFADEQRALVEAEINRRATRPGPNFTEPVPPRN